MAEIISEIFIGGEWREGRGEVMHSINPSDGSRLFSMRTASKEDVDDAVKCASDALPRWSSMSPEKRAGYLLQMADYLNKNMQKFIDAEVEDAGATVRKASADVMFVIDCIKYFAKEGQRVGFERAEMPQPPMMLTSFVVREPIGVVGAITPWNFPLIEAVWKIFPALIVGNTIVLKPASWTSLSTLHLAKAAEEVKLPKGVLNVIVGSGGKIGTYLVEHPGVSKITFTGSTEVGRDIYRRSAERIKRITLELGGKGASIVLDDADFDIASDGSIFAAFWHCGQVCIAGSRLIVLEKIYDKFMSLILEKVEKIKVGNPKDYSSGMGPIVSEQHFKDIMDWIAIGIEEGSELLFGGKRVGETGFYIQPTIFESTPDKRIAREEIFGPVLTVLKAKDENDAVRIANDVIYGLSSSVWSKNIPRALDVAKKIKAGTVWINEAHLINVRAPFGGYKQSGVGRELGIEGIKEYTELKHIAVDMIMERSKKIWYDMLF